MNDTPTPRTDDSETRVRKNGFSSLIEYCCASDMAKLERELAAVTEQRDEAREYADRLAEGLPDGMLPKDVEVLREANLGLTTELAAVKEKEIFYQLQVEQRDRFADYLKKTETELIAVTEQRDELAESLDFQVKLNRECIDQITARTKERDEARADAEKAKAYKKVLKTTNANLKRERDEAVNNYETAQLLSVRVGEQRDMLAEEVGQLKSRLTQTMGAVTISRNGYVQELEQQRDALAEALKDYMSADCGLPSTELLAVARNLHKTARKACPFITHNSGPDDHIIVMRVKNYDESWEVYESLMKFFSANASVEARQ